ncbi:MULTISPECIES: peptidylprolyl isomerase [Leuconostoc]|uniref:peptidylprolyl isomerase n=1 Tax=Leuconostoc TaxID=1243 RepID=UPI000460FA46|nr:MULTISPECIES: peptidyl-prolyl cis-trans isomerase [Leuconostoc]KDA48348.1 Foldase protein PrsA precursor/Foldase clustered with pyrimidine conversion [Leuconostoc pseudomesenteroides 1159]KDA50763.1 Foldase protein PrsA precursor/Foldase clustered with pyrimidine conversion [Leuconostoc pseudomesenteroides PS12]OQJ75287.1 peptidylprolyl isomerase [Leuconostoc pseudomesenteroides]MDG9743949.1 peptidyl-prolyl cis-trans isomerase [Leuconostoc falkenbergense]ORI53762.1 peptidylprolyl isomerase 
MRKFIWGLLVVIFVGGLIFLGFNSSKTLVTTNVGKITQKEFYNDFKKSSAGQQEFANMVINKVLAANYGKKVSKSDVQTAYDTQKAQYGSSFKTVLASNNLTQDQFKTNVKNNLIMNAAIKANYKVTQKQLKKAYASYHQNTTISMITAKDESSAKEAIAALKKGDKWATVYKKYSTDTTYASSNGQLPAFDSTSSTVDSSVQTAAFKLSKVGDYSTEPVTGSSSGYYVIQLDKTTTKPAMSKVRSKLSNKIVSDFISDSSNTTEIQAIIGKILRKNDVNVKDTDLKNALSSYLTAGISSSSSSSSK